MNTTATDFLDNIYKRWQEEPYAFLSKDLPWEKDSWKQGYSVECAPIPWFGSLGAKMIFISSEPVKFYTFPHTCYISRRRDLWEDFFFSGKFFENNFQHVPSDYYKRMAYYTQGFLGLEKDEKPVTILDKYIIDIPVIPYFAAATPDLRGIFSESKKTASKVFDHFIQRLDLINHSDTSNILNINLKTWSEIESFFSVQQIRKDVYHSDERKTHFIKATLKNELFIIIVSPPFGRHHLIHRDDIYQRGVETKQLLTRFLQETNFG